MTATQPPPTTSPLVIDVTIETAGWGEEETLERDIAHVTATAIETANLQTVAGSELSVVLTNDARVRELNHNWRAKDAPTNVLSFPGGDEDEPPYGPLLGDIILAYETVAREAAEQEKTFIAHFRHLIVHGLLHLFGYDHQINAEAEEMEALERSILGKLGESDPYADTDPYADATAP